MIEIHNTFLDIKMKIGNESIPEELWFNRVTKELREQYILGAAMEVLNRESNLTPFFAEQLLPPAPDFRVYDSKKRFLEFYEVTEILPKGWKRGKIHISEPLLNDFPSISCYSMNPLEAIQAIQSRVDQKSKKDYPTPTNLLIHFDAHIYKSRGRQYSQLPDILRQTNFEKRSFMSVLVMDVGFEHIFEIK